MAGRNLTLPIAEFEHAQVPAALSGAQGTLRGKGICSLDARNDLEAIQEWLALIANPHTARAYRREIERLLLWATLIRGAALSSLRLKDYTAYEQFMEKPPADWCLPPREPPKPGEEPKKPGYPRVARDTEEWKPFAAAMSPASRSYSMNVIKNLTTFLFQTGYLAINPMATYKIEKRARHAETERYLEHELVVAGLDAVEALPRESDEDERVYFRARFVLRLLYGVGARPHEVVKAVMGDIKQRDGKWWWYVVGKRNKERKIVMPSGLMTELTRYRRQRGLPPLPHEDETVPLVAAVRGRAESDAGPALESSERPMGSTQALLAAVRDVFKLAAKQFDKNDPRQKRLLQATTHWLRHSFATHQIDQGKALKHVKDNLGHASIDTLSIYAHSEARAKHDELSDGYDALVPS